MPEPLLDVESVREALADFPDPETGRGALAMDQIRDVRVTGSDLRMTVALTSHSRILWPDVEHAIEARLRGHFADLGRLTIDRADHARPPMKLGEIGLAAKSVIAVGSGKGGVGKSTISVSLAYALLDAGSRVGLMDADVYGPSVPQLTGTSDVRGVSGTGGNRMEPVVRNGMPIMSVGYLVPPDQAVIWRGPMLHGAVMQFLRDTEWGELDYLIVDMPPGTGDVAITISQAIPLTGAVVVCTPQEVALLDAVKAIAMFRKVNIPVLGMVENMSGFICPDTGKRYDIFGRGGARAKAEELGIAFLGEAPIHIALRERGDDGATIDNIHDPVVGPYLRSIAHTLVKNLATAAAARPARPALPVLG
ncbi:MAG: Mrp/NBP35 family ATP-binding protein [Planctomycetes bacterium]|nr:Mrp/NBP35 family ATP-binding protein [Planctomycetota bacterium]